MKKRTFLFVLMMFSAIGSVALSQSYLINDGFEDGNYNGWTPGDGTISVTTEQAKAGSHSLKVADTSPTSSGQVTAAFLPVSDLLTVEYDQWVNGFGWNDGAPVSFFAGDNLLLSVAQQNWTDGYYRYRDNTDANWETSKDFPNKPQISEKQWYHFKLELEPSNGKIRLWIDGTFEGEISVPVVGAIDAMVVDAGWSTPTTAFCYLDDVKVSAKIVHRLPFTDNFENGNYDGWIVGNGTVSASTEQVKTGNYSLKISDTSPDDAGWTKLDLAPISDKFTVEYDQWVNSFGWNDGAPVSFFAGDELLLSVAQQNWTDGYYRYRDNTDANWETSKDFPNKPQISERQWYHFKLELEPSNGKVRLWIDGTFEGEISVPVVGAIDAMVVDAGWSTPATAFCYLDDVRLYQSLHEIPIAIHTESVQVSGTSFWVDIDVGSPSLPVGDLKVASFILKYSNSSILSYMDYEVGPFLTNAQAAIIPDEASGEISVSVYRLSGGNSGHGTILRLHFAVSENIQQVEQICFSIPQVQANDDSGEFIQLVPEGSSCVEIYPIVVWPGDANNDGSVNVFDINSIVAVHWQKTGPKRTNATTGWSGQPCQPWSPLAAVYADCNGDGSVNIFDINPVITNYGKSHGLQKPVVAYELASPQANPPIQLIARDRDPQTEEFWLDVVVGSAENQVTDLKVVSFELKYDNTESVEYISYELGQFFTNAQAAVVVEDSIGKISASIYQLDNGNSGSGVVLSFKLKRLSKITEVVFKFGNILANDSAGATLPLVPDTCLYTRVNELPNASPGMPDTDVLHQNHPNPFNPQTTIQFSLSAQELVTLTIFNTRGEQVGQLVNQELAAGHYSVPFVASSLPSGTYFYRLHTRSFTQVRKMLLIK